jgi:chromosome segregation ATPase
VDVFVLDVADDHRALTESRRERKTLVAADEQPSQEHRRMSDQPGVGELGRGLNALKDEVRDLKEEVRRLPDAFSERMVSRERYEADEDRRKVERETLQKQVGDIDEWKKNAGKRALGIIGACTGVAAATGTIAAVILR